MDDPHQLEIVIALLAAVLALATAARRVLIPYPIFLVLGGVVIGLVPNIPIVRLDPDLVFLVFLPPVLYAAAYFTSLRDFRANLRPITLLAIGLVLATTAVVAAVARFVMPWTVGVLIGLIVGWLVCWALRLTEDSLTETTITLLAPYAAWLLAERTHTSGVLACVAAGLYVRRYFSAAVAPATRMQSLAVWNVLIFVLNGVVFALIGLQLGAIRASGIHVDLGTLVRLG